MLSPLPHGSDSGIESQSSPEVEDTDQRPASRTHQYRKVMKPLLERKRRARINSCLDELKDLMVSALQTEGESITKLEKADVLELTVRHLRKLKAHGALGLTPSSTYMERYRAGYTLCASEVSKYVSSGSAGVPVAVSARLLQHLALTVRGLEAGGGPPSHHHAPVAASLSNLQEFLSPGKLDALRYSMLRPPITPSSQVVRADIALVPSSPSPPSSPSCPPTTEDTAWRPW